MIILLLVLILIAILAPRLAKALILLGCIAGVAWVGLMVVAFFVIVAQG